MLGRTRRAAPVENARHPRALYLTISGGALFDLDELRFGAWGTPRPEPSTAAELRATPIFRVLERALESPVMSSSLPFVAKFVVREKREHTVNVEISSGKWGPARRITVVMAPVTPNTPTLAWSQEEKSDENAKFWSATPTGAFEITMLPDEAERYPIGGQFKIYFGPGSGDAEGEWSMSGATLHFSGAIGFTLYPRGHVSGKLEMHVEQPETCLRLHEWITKRTLAHLDMKRAGEQNVGSAPWVVEVEPA